MSRFRILVRTFSVHRGDMIKQTQRPLVNPFTSMVSNKSGIKRETPPRKLTSSSSNYERHEHSTAILKPHCGERAMPRERVDKTKS